jgi:hypothetical protein
MIDKPSNPVMCRLDKTLDWDHNEAIRERICEPLHLCWLGCRLKKRLAFAGTFFYFEHLRAQSVCNSVLELFWYAEWNGFDPLLPCVRRIEGIHSLKHFEGNLSCVAL